MRERRVRLSEIAPRLGAAQDQILARREAEREFFRRLGLSFEMAEKFERSMCVVQAHAGASQETVAKLGGAIERLGR